MTTSAINSIDDASQAGIVRDFQINAMTAFALASAHAFRKTDVAHSKFSDAAGKSAELAERRRRQPDQWGVCVAPILDDDRTIYLRASDFAEDGEAPQSLYRFRVRVRTDPDTNEPNNLYSPNVPMVDNQSPGQQRKFVMDAGNNGRLQPVPVHACGGGAVDPCERELKACERSDDQDGDGLEGYPLDPGCRSPTDDDEATPNPAPACAYRGLQTDPADSDRIRLIRRRWQGRLP